MLPAVTPFQARPGSAVALLIGCAAAVVAAAVALTIRQKRPSVAAPAAGQELVAHR